MLSFCLLKLTPNHLVDDAHIALDNLHHLGAYVLIYVVRHRDSILTIFAFEDDASFFKGFQGVPLAYRDAHAYLGGIGRKLIRGCFLACIVIIMLHYFSAKDDNRFGRASMAMDGQDSTRFYSIEDALG